LGDASPLGLDLPTRPSAAPKRASCLSLDLAVEAVQRHLERPALVQDIEIGSGLELVEENLRPWLFIVAANVQHARDVVGRRDQPAAPSEPPLVMRLGACFLRIDADVHDAELLRVPRLLVEAEPTCCVAQEPAIVIRPKLSTCVVALQRLEHGHPAWTARGLNWGEEESVEGGSDQEGRRRKGRLLSVHGRSSRPVARPALEQTSAAGSDGSDAAQEPCSSREGGQKCATRNEVVGRCNRTAVTQSVVR